MRRDIITQQLRSQYNPDGSDLRQVQLRMLQLLITFDNICRKHNLRYWLSFGTLLGAARHNGFIPWDDDTDVCMPREDAIKLKSLMGNRIYNNQLILQTKETDPHYINSSWMTIRDIKSEYIQDSDLHNSLKYRGLQIDIFIIDEGLSPLLKKISTYYQTHLIWGPWLNRKERIFRPTVKVFHSLFERVISPLFRSIKFNKDLDIGYGCPFGKPVPSEIIFPLKEIKFEGYDFFCPNNVDTYLTALYGDWSQIPPQDKIVTHNVKFILRD